MPLRHRLSAGLLAAITLILPLGAPAHERDGASVPPSLGRLVFPTSTHSRPAQRAFVEGMLWLHLFEYEHAAESFRKAQQLDKNFVMAYWGEAMTQTHSLWNQDKPDAARAVLQKLAPTPKARAAKARTPRERAWLDAAEKMFGPGTLRERDTAYLAAMAALAKAYPRDDEAQLFHALALMGVTRGERDLPNYLKGGEIARRVFRHNPLHPGAAHYWIHALDDPDHADGALEAAQALSKIAPGAGHGQHMTSHIFIALGRWQDVIDANESAIAVVAAERAAKKIPMVRCGHYSEWLQYAYYQIGREQDGNRMLRQCFDDRAAALAWYQSHAGEPGAGTVPLARRKRYADESLAGMRGTALIETELDLAGNLALPVDLADMQRAAGWDHFARGFTAARSGDAATGRAALVALEAVMQLPPDEGETPAGAVYLKVMALMLQAALAQADGRSDEAIALATDAAQRYEAVPFDYGPPAPVKPPREFAGELLLQAGKPKEALAEFERALKTAPQRRLSLQGRQRAMAAAGATAMALPK